MEMPEQLEVNADMPKQKMLDIFGGLLQFDVPLAEYSSFHTGGSAAFFIDAKTVDDAIHVVVNASQNKIPFFIIGGGSNLLISDNGYDGLVIKINVSGIKKIGDTIIECGAGEELMSLVSFAAENSLQGIEFAAGIWGSVGGAVYGNAGAFGGEIKDVLTEITLLERSGKVKNISPDYCRFDYRDSYLKQTQ